MLVTFVVLALVNGQANEVDTFTATDDNQAVKVAYSDCKAQARMLKPCMLRTIRPDGATVYVNTESWYQLVIPAKSK